MGLKEWSKIVILKIFRIIYFIIGNVILIFIIDLILFKREGNSLFDVVLMLKFWYFRFFY